MAFQGKGIMGTPKGKVGNLMFYIRNGKGIVQHCPTGNGDVKRLVNEHLAGIIKFLDEVWEVMIATWKNNWVNSPMYKGDLKQAYIDQNVYLVGVNKSINANNLWVSPPFSIEEVGLTLQVDYDQMIVKVLFEEGARNEYGELPNVLVYRAYNDSGVRKLNGFDQLIGIQDEIILNLNHFYVDNVLFGVVFLRYPPNNLYSQLLFIDVEQER